MKIVFKVIAIVGVLSFIGGLKNGVFFFFGLILAGVFGYFGWRPEKHIVNDKNLKKDNTQQKIKTEENKRYNNVISEEVTISDNKIGNNGESSDKELKTKIDLINRKLNLLESSFSEGLLSKHEFEKKKKILIKKNSYSYKKTSINQYLKPVFIISVVSIFVFLIFQLNNDNTNLFNSEMKDESNFNNIDESSTIVRSENYDSKIIEKPKVTKYVVFNFKTKEAEILYIERTKGYYLSNEYHEGLPPFTAVTYKENEYTSEIIEIIDYNENKLYLQKDVVRNDLKNKLNRNDETIKINLSSGSYELSHSELMILFNNVNSEITNEKIHEFNTYKDASLWKIKN